MDRNASRWWFLNPLDWFKWVYELSGGEKNPVLSCAITILVFGVIGAVIWRAGFIQHQKEVHNSEPRQTTIQTGNATVSGRDNVTNTGDGAKIESKSPSPK